MKTFNNYIQVIPRCPKCNHYEVDIVPVYNPNSTVNNKDYLYILIEYFYYCLNCGYSWEDHLGMITTESIDKSYIWYYDADTNNYISTLTQ